MRIIALPYRDMDTVSIDGKRYYNTPDNNQYLSVTTFLGATSEKDFLDKWRNDVGPLEADRIVKYASERGNDLHDMCERYLSGERGFEKEYNFEFVLLFRAMKQKLKYITHVQYLECALYSKILRLAGRCDCIGFYKGNLSIIDFKNSRKLKKEEWITDYFLQCTLYSLMIEEITGVVINQLTVLVAVNEFKTQEFIKDRRDYIPLLAKRYKTFQEKFTNYFEKFV